MKIITNITDTQIHSSEYKEGSTFSGYHFISCDITASIKVDDKEFVAAFQTGHSFDGGDYGRPSNTLSVYDDGSSPLLWKLDNICESELEDDEVVEEINEYSGTCYSSSELLSIREALRDIECEAQWAVNDAEREADEEKEADETIYVIQEYVEDGEQCGYPTVEIFNNEDDANDYIESNSNSYIDFEKGRKLYQEYQEYKRNKAC